LRTASAMILMALSTIDAAIPAVFFLFRRIGLLR